MIVSVWLAVNIIGLIVTLVTSWDAWQDLRVLHKADLRNGRRIVAWANLRTQVNRAVIFASFLTAGYVTAADVAARRSVFVACLIAAAILLVVNSVADWVTTRKLMRRSTRLDR